jgi:hypothetical protein
MTKFFGPRAVKAFRVLLLLRFALSGAVVGAAAAGLLSASVGGPDHASALGAAGGFILVAVVKLAHLI